jgi:hypothetical protein
MARIRSRRASDQEIMRAIGYITDDKYLASYFGVDIKLVSHLRKLEKQSEARRRQPQNDNLMPPYGGMISDCERKRNAEIKKGSAQLLKALNKFFEKRILERRA